MQTLSKAEINDRLKQLSGWKQDGNSIKNEWQFGDFIEAFAFMSKVAMLAEKHEHHPEMFNVFNKVSLSFSTHSAGGLTEKDFNIAADIDNL